MPEVFPHSVRARARGNGLRSVIQNTGLSAAAAILDRGSVVVLTALLSSSLAPEAFKQFGEFQLTLTMLAAFSGMGVTVSAARLFAETDAGKPTDPSLIGTMWTLSLAAAAVLGSATIAIGNLIGSGLAELQLIPNSALLIGVIFLAGGIVASGGILGLSLFNRSALIGVVSAAIVLVGGWIAAYERSAAIAAWSLVIAHGATALLSSVVVLRKVGWRMIFVAPIITQSRVRAVYGLIGPLAGVGLLAALCNWLMGHMLLWLSPSQFAFSGFIIGLQWFALVQFLPGMMSRAVFPLLVRANLPTDSRRALLMSTSLSLGMALCVAVAIAISSPFIVEYYDSRAIPDGAVLVAFAVAALPQAAVSIIANVLIVHGRQTVWLYLGIFSFGVQIAATFALSGCNALGAATSMFIAGLVLALATWGYAHREGLL
jgi:O-antigen/teichoic acid export membrane protein